MTLFLGQLVRAAGAKKRTYTHFHPHTPVRVICEEKHRRQQDVEDDRREEEHLKAPKLEQVLDVIFRPAQDSVRQVLVEGGILRGAAWVWVLGKTRNGREKIKSSSEKRKTCPNNRLKFLLPTSFVCRHT